MTTTFVRPGESNTYVPDHAATGNLVIGYSRNPDDFPLNQYVQLAPVTKDQGFYLRVTTEEAGRIMSSDLAEFVWPDGADRPQNNDGTESFGYLPYKTKRMNYPFKLGDKSREQADWAITDTHKSLKAQQAMTARTVRAHAVLGSDSNFEAAHVAVVANISGNSGPWDASTVARQDIKRSLNYAAEIILKSTLSVVRKKDLRLVLDVTTAHQISECQEIVDHIKGSPEAYSQVKGETGKWSQYGLPDKLYGYNVVVEDTTKVTSRRGAATATRDFVATPGRAYLLARPGSLVAPAGNGPNFSSICAFLYEEMTVEEFRDAKNRRIEGHVVEDFDMVVTASSSSFVFKDVLT